MIARQHPDAGHQDSVRVGQRFAAGGAEETAADAISRDGRHSRQPRPQEAEGTDQGAADLRSRIQPTGERSLEGCRDQIGSLASKELLRWMISR